MLRKEDFEPNMKTEDRIPGAQSENPAQSQRFGDFIVKYMHRRLYHRGKSKAGASLVTYCMKNRRGETRVGITTSKKIGTAVERNRARRVIRAAFSQLEDGVTGWDLVFVARSRTTRVKMQVVLADMEKQLTALGVLSHEEHR